MPGDSDHLPARDQRFLLTLIETIQQAVVVTALDGSILYWNQGAETLYLQKATEVVGQRLARLTTDGELALRLQAISICSMNGEAWTGELRITRRDGQTVWVAVATSPIRDEDGDVIGTIWISWDVTELKRFALYALAAEADRDDAGAEDERAGG
jgi:PAS domain S-box-containing protein